MNAVIFRDAAGTWLAEWELPFERAAMFDRFDELTAPGRPPAGAATATLIENGRRTHFKQVIGADPEPVVDEPKPKKRGK